MPIGCGNPEKVATIFKKFSIRVTFLFSRSSMVFLSIFVTYYTHPNLIPRD